jgi:hypothetical protein
MNQRSEIAKKHIANKTLRNIEKILFLFYASGNPLPKAFKPTEENPLLKFLVDFAQYPRKNVNERASYRMSFRSTTGEEKRFVLTLLEHVSPIRPIGEIVWNYYWDEVFFLAFLWDQENNRSRIAHNKMCLRMEPLSRKNMDFLQLHKGLQLYHTQSLLKIHLSHFLQSPVPQSYSFSAINITSQLFDIPNPQISAVHIFLFELTLPRTPPHNIAILSAWFILWELSEKVHHKRQEKIFV